MRVPLEEIPSIPVPSSTFCTLNVFGGYINILQKNLKRAFFHARGYGEEASGRAGLGRTAEGRSELVERQLGKGCRPTPLDQHSPTGCSPL